MPNRRDVILSVSSGWTSSLINAIPKQLPVWGGDAIRGWGIRPFPHTI